MRIYKDMPQIIQELSDIICDSCGNSCKTESGFEFMFLRAYWGYYSKHDGDKWTADICEECVENKLSFINFQKEEGF